MNTEKLSNLQLLLLFKNRANNRHVRKLAEMELAQRQLSIEEKQELYDRVDVLTQAEKQASLPNLYKVLLLVFAPLFSHIVLMILHNIISSVLLDKGYFKMQKQYWFFVTISYALWTAVLLVIAKMILE